MFDVQLAQLSGDGGETAEAESREDIAPHRRLEHQTTVIESHAQFPRETSGRRKFVTQMSMPAPHSESDLQEALGSADSVTWHATAPIVLTAVSDVAHVSIPFPSAASHKVLLYYTVL